MENKLFGDVNDEGYLPSERLSKILRKAVQFQVRFRQACDIKDAYQGKKGEEFRWNNKGKVCSAMMEGLGNSVPTDDYPLKMEKEPLIGFVEGPLKIDAVSQIEMAAHAKFDETPLRVAPTGGSSDKYVTLMDNSQMPIVNDCEMTANHIKEISSFMKARGIIPFGSDDYLAIGRPKSFEGFKDDLEPVHSYSESGFGHSMNGEMGRINNVRFIKQTNISSEGWEKGKSDAVFFIGDDAVTEAIVESEHIVARAPSDFGKKRGLVWMYCGGFTMIHKDPDKATVLKWDSKS